MINTFNKEKINSHKVIQNIWINLNLFYKIFLLSDQVFLRQEDKEAQNFIKNGKQRNQEVQEMQ